MLLQTDPTVIYGMGEKFDGNLRRRDLLADTPWNTYTRAGLPPTPISMPGKASLIAAVQPERTQALYFVARGDGTSHFSPTLDEHNRAVNRYQRGQPAPQGSKPHRQRTHHKRSFFHAATGLVHHIRGHRRGGKVLPHRGRGRGAAPRGPHGHRDPRARGERPWPRPCARCC